MRTISAKLKRVASHLVETLGEDSCIVIGAIAVAAHGYARATTDVDLMFRGPLPEARRRLAKHGVKSVISHGGVHEGGIECLKGVLEGIEFDILPPLVPIAWGHSVDVPLAGGGKLRVVDLPTLIHLKLRAGGPQDVLDVVMLLQRHPVELARARNLATAYGLAAQMESFMNSPRIKAKAPNPDTRRSRRSRKT